MDEPDPSELWDCWKTAREAQPDLTPEEFVRGHGGDVAAALALLLTLIGVERTAEPSPLVEALLTPDGMVFAGYRILRSLGQGSRITSWSLPVNAGTLVL